MVWKYKKLWFWKIRCQRDKIIANFTQVVHKASTKLGVVLAKNIKSGDVYSAANYQEKGNYLGSFKYSVYPVLLDNKKK